MADLRLHFSDDMTVAYLDVPDISTVRPSIQMIQSLIKRNHIVVGINEAILSEIVHKNRTGKNIPIAVGNAVKIGIDEHLIWFVDYERAGKPKEIDGKRVDHRELLSNINVSKGDMFARIERAVPAVPGLTVTGMVIAPPENDEHSIEIGKGVTTGESGELIAEIDGAIKFNGTRIEICNDKTIFSDIDYSTGNITFNGFLKIRGTVRSGFKVTATGDILVHGDVEDAEIKSGGSVVVQGGVIGTSRGTIECIGSIAVKHAAHFTLIAGQGVTVEEDALHTTITAEENIWIKNVVGGVIRGLSITAETGGCSTEIKTTLDISHIDHLIRERYDLLKQFGVLAVERNRHYDKMFSLVCEGMDVKGYLNDVDQQALASIKSETLSSIQASARIQERMGVIEDAEKGWRNGSFLKIGRVYPGVVIKVGTEERIITEERRNFAITAAHE